MAKRQKHPLVRDMLDHSLTQKDLAQLYDCLWFEWTREERPGQVAHRFMRLAIDVSPLNPDARRQKAALAVQMLEFKRLEQGRICSIEQLAMSALIDLLGRNCT